MQRVSNSNTANLNGWVRSLAKSCVSLSTEAGRACSSGSRAQPRLHERIWNRLNLVVREEDWTKSLPQRRKDAEKPDPGRVRRRVRSATLRHPPPPLVRSTC